MPSIPHKSTPPDDHGGNYSVDEMMARLKKGDRQKRNSSDKDPDGKLVTREDGTQVMKVRRRKRRSKQAPKKSEEQTNPKLKWGILGSLVALIVILAVGTIFIIAKYNGSKFLTNTESTISDLTGAQETTISQLLVTPLSAKASKTEIAWDKHTFLNHAEFSGIRAKIKATSFLSSDWIGEEIVASTGNVHLQNPSNQTEYTSDTLSSPYQFGAYRCNQLSLFFGSNRNAPSITDLEVSLQMQDNDRYQIVFHNGTMKIQNWPEMHISSGIAKLNSESVSIEAQLKAKAAHAGELTIKGNVSKKTRTPASLEVKAKNYPIQELLGANLGRMIKGEIQSDIGTFSYNYNHAPEQALSFILPFNSTEIQCEGLPMFNELNKLIGNTSYVRPIFYNCRGTISRTSDGLVISDLKFINNSLLILTGNITVSAKGKLSGTLTASVPKSKLGDRVPQPFTGPSGGFYHLDVTLSGTILTPNDNLHELLKASRPTPKAKPNINLDDFQQPGNTQTKPQPQQGEKDFDALMR